MKFLIIGAAIVFYSLAMSKYLEQHNVDSEAAVAQAQQASDDYKANWYTQCAKQFTVYQCHIIASIQHSEELP